MIIKKTIVMDISKKEYELLMYNRQNKIDLSLFNPGFLGYHYDKQNMIRKHEMKIQGIGDKLKIVEGA